jgi:hypothetical protein
MPPRRKSTCSIVLPTNCPVGMVQIIRSNEKKLSYHHRERARLRLKVF